MVSILYIHSITQAGQAASYHPFRQPTSTHPGPHGPPPAPIVHSISVRFHFEFPCEGAGYAARLRGHPRTHDTKRKRLAELRLISLDSFKQIQTQTLCTHSTHRARPPSVCTSCWRTYTTVTGAATSDGEEACFRCAAA